MGKRKLEDYSKIIGKDEVREIRKYGEFLAGCSIQHINSTRIGGGVAEILENLVPLMEEVGLTAKWSVIKGSPEFYNVTKAFHNALHGQETEITPEMFETYLENRLRGESCFDR